MKARLSKGLTKWNEQSRDSQNAISSVKHDKDKVETRARNDRNKPGKTKENELTTHGLGSKFRKLASQELERLKRHQPSEYLKIQQKYFDSMTEKQRKTWNEVTSRVRPELRDQQLKLMLIRFMVNNPNLWASKASASSSEKNKLSLGEGGHLSNSLSFIRNKKKGFLLEKNLAFIKSFSLSFSIR